MQKLLCSTVILLSTFSFAACSSKEKKSDSAETTASKTAEAQKPKVLPQFTALKDKVCACKTSQCASEEMKKLDEMRKTIPSAEERKQIEKLMKEMMQCVSSLGTAAAQ